MFKLEDKIEKYNKYIGDSSFKIRNMTLEDLKLAVKWAAKEGWNPGLHDAEAFYATDPDGYFIGELDGKPVAVISAVIYNDEFSFWGFYIVDPEYRSKGYGLAVFKVAMDYLGDRNIGGDGVVAQLENYQKAGFDIAYRNLRYEGIAQVKDSKNTVDLRTVPFELVNKYDYEMFLAPRPVFLNRWINMPDSYALGVMKGDRLAGYSVLRKCYSGYKVGPLFADDAQIANDLLNGLTKNIAGEKYYLDVPEPNPAAIEIARNNDMKICFETARIYTKKPPELPLNNIFGVTTFELG